MTTIQIGYGVFNPKGELEAVSLLQSEALFYAENLSPKDNGKTRINRTVEEVTVLLGRFDLSDDNLIEIADKVRRHINERKQLLTETDSKT